MDYETNHFFSQRLARRPSPSCLGTQTARLETACHCPGLRLPQYFNSPIELDVLFWAIL